MSNGMNNSSGLGRGLDSLIPSKNSALLPTTDNTELPSVNNLVKKVEGEKIVELPVDKILPNPYQPRSEFAIDDLGELQDSIKEHGVIQPIIACQVGNEWQLIAGERRLRAVKALGKQTIPAIVRDANKQKKLEIALIENLQRKDLNVLETAMAYKQLMDEFDLNQESLAKKVGKSRSSVANTLRILNATGEVKEAIDQGKISGGHARTLTSLPEEDQKELLGKIISDGYNVRDTEKAGRQVVIKKHIRKLNINPEIDAKAEKLQQALGAKVEVKKFGESGQIIIRFFSNEELEDLIQKISSR